jgi:hypothetical protein
LVYFVYFVDLVHLVSFVQPNKQDKPNKPNNGLLLLKDFFSTPLYELCAGPGKYPNGWFNPSCELCLCTPGLDRVGDLVTLS